jgi:hypothetical protein
MSKQDSKKGVESYADVGSASVSSAPVEARAVDSVMGSQLFLAGGVLAGVLGALCAVGPKLLPAQANLFAQAASRGVTPGVLWSVTAVLVAFGILAKALGRNVEALAVKDDQSKLIDQITSDLGQTRTSMQELRVEFVYLKDHVTNMGRDLPSQIASANESSTRDAMYRLAASLDQVGARLEQRIRSQHGTLEGTLQEVQQSLQATAEQIVQLQQSLTQVSSAPAVAWDAPAEPLPAPISLGVLDHLADEHHSGDSPEGEIEPALPDSATYEEKLVQLAHLLADPRVRAAADGMSHSRGL